MYFSSFSKFSASYQILVICQNLFYTGADIMAGTAAVVQEAGEGEEEDGEDNAGDGAGGGGQGRMKEGRDPREEV